MEEINMCRVGTTKIVNVRTIKTKIETSYPSSWFEANNRRKPNINLRKNQLTKAQLRAASIRGVTSGKLNKEVAKSFLITYGETLVETLDSDWTSYGVEIGKAGEEVKVTSTLQVNYTDTPMPGTTVEADDGSIPDSDIAMVLLFIHRINKLSELADVSHYYEGLRRQMSTKDSILAKNVARLSEYGGWTSDKDYNRIVAAYDMFFVRFPNHENSSIRIATVTSRFKDCAGLISFGHLADLLGVKGPRALDWIFDTKVGDEILKIFSDSDADEASNPHSYFPYQSDMGLVSKTSYSSVANPHLFFLVHAIGSLMKSQRSLNARMLQVSGLETLVKNALIIAYAFKRRTEMEKAFTVTGLPIEVAGLEEDEDDQEDEVPTQSGSEAYAYMALKNFKPTQGMRKLLEEYKRTVTDLRNDTVGKFLSDYTLV